jgi:Astacin (Peptidase family M12A)
MARKKTIKYCNQPPVTKKEFAPNVNANRKSFILSSNLKWVNGTDLAYSFLAGANSQRAVVRKAFNHWKNLGIGLSFTEVPTANESLIRIAFDRSDGSWSYVGRDNLTIPQTEATMNFGWDLTNSYGWSTALHEIGHAIGFQHEHQSPFSGIVWNEPAVYREFSGPPNKWSKKEIDSNIIEKMPANQVKGSNWDAKSIMQYEFDKGLILQPVQYQNGIYPPGILSPDDIRGVRQFYPPVKSSAMVKLQVGKSVPIAALSGGQSDFVFKAPFTKKYTFQTVGELDTVMVVSEKAGKQKHYMGGDDDSGFDKNAKVVLPLVKNREYIVNVRVMFAASANSSFIIVS